MAPPVGEEVFVSTKGRVTRHNDDGTFNVKVGNRPGRPFKKSSADLVRPPLPLIPAVPAAPPKEDDCSEGPQKGSKGRLVSWASVLTIGGAVVLGVFHGIGTKMVEIVWPYIRALARLHS
jgi:hypothetical protein